MITIVKLSCLMVYRFRLPTCSIVQGDKRNKKEKKKKPFRSSVSSERLLFSIASQFSQFSFARTKLFERRSLLSPLQRNDRRGLSPRIFFPLNLFQKFTQSVNIYEIMACMCFAKLCAFSHHAMDMSFHFQIRSRVTHDSRFIQSFKRQIMTD